MRPPGFRNRVLLVFMAAVFAGCVGLSTSFCVRYRAENCFLLTKFIPRAAAADATGVEALRNINGYIAQDVVARPGPHIRDPLRRALKASPGEVAEYGGNCGARARLMVTVAQLLGYRSRKVYVYNPHVGEGTAYVHALAEILIDDRWVLFDPTFGLVYADEKGRLCTYEEVAASRELLASIAGGTALEKLLPGSTPRRIRWNILPGGEMLERLLVELVGRERVNRMSWPELLSRPYLAASYFWAAIALLVGLWLLEYCLAHRGMRSGRKSRQNGKGLL